MEFDDAIVLKISKSDKRLKGKVAEQKRMSLSAYVRNSMYVKALQDVKK